MLNVYQRKINLIIENPALNAVDASIKTETSYFLS